MLNMLNINRIFKLTISAINLRQFSQDCVKVSQYDGVREIKLNEPKTRNSLSIEMMDAILMGINRDLSDKHLRCIVLTAEGNVWSAGHNLKELCMSQEQLQQLEIFQRLTDIILCIQKAPIPVIAKVNGIAAAAGCQLVASCDIIVASEKSTFLTPGANFGIFCSTPGIAISRVMSRPKAAYMLMTGLPLTAQQAYTAGEYMNISLLQFSLEINTWLLANLKGLVSCVVPEDQLTYEMNKITSAIKMKSRAVIALGKDFLYKQLQLPLEEAYTLGEWKMTENLALEDSQEGLKSFIEKRPPKWKHE